MAPVNGLNPSHHILKGLMVSRPELNNFLPSTSYYLFASERFFLLRSLSIPLLFHRLDRIPRPYSKVAFSTIPPMPKEKQSQPEAPPSAQKKHCATCGRLISSNHRNFEERKYCSKTCSSPRSKPSEFDRQIERCFVEWALKPERKHSGVTCDDVEGVMRVGLESQDGGDEDEEGGMKLHEGDAQKEGMERAQFRERVRRAGRRVVAFGAPVPSDEDAASEGKRERFECVQQGRAVESSFAKGDWAVRVVG